MGLLESERGLGERGGAVVDYGQASLHRHFRIQFGRIEIFFALDFLTLNGLGSNRTMVG